MTTVFRPLTTRMPFGQYRDAPVSEVPPEYLEWVLRTVWARRWRGTPLRPDLLHDIGVACLESYDAQGDRVSVARVLALVAHVTKEEIA